MYSPVLATYKFTYYNIMQLIGSWTIKALYTNLFELLRLVINTT